MKIEFRCKEHGTIPPTSIGQVHPAYAVVCFGCDMLLICRIDNGQVIRDSGKEAPTIHACGRPSDSAEWSILPESDSPYYLNG